ncbi:MAG: GTPase RsgA [Bacteriovorax sp.]|jgi:ribosome biogenesis GTPase|nr:GTPase RsgA [Bacteriovorax sp.]
MECGDGVILIDEDNVEQFTPYILLSKETSVVIGSSGVGKSTLINYIFDTKVQKTLEIGENDKGKHTTTTRKLFLTESGHYLMDNPGIRALSFDGNDSGIEVPCRYTNCTHSNEPGSLRKLLGIRLIIIY